MHSNSKSFKRFFANMVALTKGEMDNLEEIKNLEVWESILPQLSTLPVHQRSGPKIPKFESWTVNRICPSIFDGWPPFITFKESKGLQNRTNLRTTSAAAEERRMSGRNIWISVTMFLRFLKIGQLNFYSRYNVCQKKDVMSRGLPQH